MANASTWLGLIVLLGTGCQGLAGYDPATGPTSRDAASEAMDATRLKDGAFDLQPADVGADRRVDGGTPDGHGDVEIDAVVPDTSVDGVVPDSTVDGVAPDTRADATAPDSDVDAIPPDALAADATSDLSADAGATCSRVLVISEMMIASTAGDDAVQEWIEIANLTSAAVPLNGWKLKDDDMAVAHTITTNISVPAYGYVVLGRGDDPDIAANHIYGTGSTCTIDLCLDDVTDRVQLLEPNDDLADEVDYNSVFPIAQGRAISRIDLCASGNDPTNWCQEIDTAYDGKNYGTPGVVASCP